MGGPPQVTLPAGALDGCPVALSLIGWAGADATLLDLVAMIGAYCGA